ncbi:MAG: 50S ribosomal protein L2 [Patescibacteria group bacterium]
MGIKIYKPTTNGRRKMSVLTYEEITKTKPEKSLVKRIKKHAGRNSQGKITIRHQGGGYLKKYRMVDFKQVDKLNIPAKVAAIEYDPGRSAFIMLVNYKDGEKRYHIAPAGMEVGSEIVTKVKAKPQVGNRMKLRNVPVGFDIHNVELNLGKGGQMVRSAGSGAKLVSLEGEMAHVQFPSGEVRLIHKDCYATIGVVSNADHQNVRIGKAGRMRHMGWKPQVLGKSMNPNDHPHGGGEGHSPIGLPGPRTPWGKPALGYKTRWRKKYSNKYIISRKKDKKTQ